MEEELSELYDRRRELAEEIAKCSSTDTDFNPNKKYQKLVAQFDSVNEQINEIIGYE
jgi:uncharacterized coiled-coil DUF342 family protein